MSLANKTEEGLIKIKCTGTEELPLDKIKEFQGALKKRTKAQKEKLLESLKTYGFSFPFFIWKNEGINWCLDGHGRLEVLNSLLNKDQLPTFPVVYVQAEDEAEAKKKLLQLNSQYGEIDTEGLQEFIDGIDIDMSEFEIPEIQKEIKDVGEKAEIKFTEHLGEENNYIVLKFNLDIDFLNAQSLLGLETVKAFSTNKNIDNTTKTTKAGIGRVIDGVEAIKKIRGEL